jgi:hypothetical protein
MTAHDAVYEILKLWGRFSFVRLTPTQSVMQLATESSGRWSTANWLPVECFIFQRDKYDKHFALFCSHLPQVSACRFSAADGF